MVVEPWHKLMDGGMPVQEQQQVEALAKQTMGVKGLGQLRTRFISACDIEVDCDILVDERLTVASGHRIADAVSRIIRNAFRNVRDVIVHVEPWSGDERR